MAGPGNKGSNERQREREQEESGKGRKRITTLGSSTRNLVQRRVRNAKERYFLDEFQYANQPNLIWRKLRHLGLLKPRTSEERLAFSVEDLNRYFTGSGSVPGGLEDGAALYLGEENYDDFKFYWKYIEPRDIIKVVLKNKSK